MLRRQPNFVTVPIFVARPINGKNRAIHDAVFSLPAASAPSQAGGPAATILFEKADQALLTLAA
ncbi:hypothetical protein NCHU2750_27210 [Neorhizobium sp. NCHU2750]|nr:hypothetical protein NCHU2750_27210 [Neorhizobium sp. NCHU2750]